MFILLSAAIAYLASPPFKENVVFSAFNFALIHQTIWSLRVEVEKIINALLSLDDLSSDLAMVVDSVRILEKKNYLLAPGSLAFVNGDLVFEKVIFAYPTRSDNV